MSENNNALANINEAKAFLSKANTLYEIVDIRDKAMAIAAYQDAKGASEASNEAKELQLRCERKAGAFFSELEKSSGGRPSRNSSNIGRVSKQEVLDEVGVTRQDANRWDQISKIPEDEFELFLEQTKESGKELTTTGALRVARELSRDTTPPQIPDGKYRVIYADPPWKYTSGDQHSKESQETTLATHYPSMTIQELSALPIKNMSQDNAVLFMWTTSPLLEECFEVINAWGFKYKASIVWNKDAHNVGHYVSVRHEFLLICTRGSCTPDSDKLLPSVVCEKRTEHSVKPETFRTMIDAMYPKGKRIELFARRPAKGWDVWGNDV